MDHLLDHDHIVEVLFYLGSCFETSHIADSTARLHHPSSERARVRAVKRMHSSAAGLHQRTIESL